jgi:hypothetical protein
VGLLLRFSQPGNWISREALGMGSFIISREEKPLFSQQLMGLFWHFQINSIGPENDDGALAGATSSL